VYVHGDVERSGTVRTGTGNFVQYVAELVRARRKFEEHKIGRTHRQGDYRSGGLTVFALQKVKDKAKPFIGAEASCFSPSPNKKARCTILWLHPS
jgi:hypothetical protein